MNEVLPFFYIFDMPSLRAHIFNIRNLASGGATDRSHPFGDRQIAHWIRYWRNFLLKNDIQKRNEVKQGYIQDLGCVPVCKADASRCKEFCWGEDVFFVELPEVLDLPDNMGLYFFGLVDKRTKIPVNDYNYGTYNKYQKFVPKRIYGEKIDNTIYLFNVDPLFPLKGVNAQVIAADPANLSTCTKPGDPLLCFDWDIDCYPIPPGMESAMYDLILEHELNIARSIHEDRSDIEDPKSPL